MSFFAKPRTKSPSRRKFLSGAAALGLSAPWMSLVSRVAHSDEPAAPLRFLYMFTGNGHNTEHFVPQNPLETGFSFAPALTPLEAHRDNLMLVHGIRGFGAHHQGMSEALTGRPSEGVQAGATGGPSLDQLLAERLRGKTLLASLELGVNPGNQLVDQITYAPSGLPLPAIGSPRGAFDRIFGLANEDPAAATARRARKRSVLDAVAKDLTTLQGRLDPIARVLLDEHLTLVRAQELDLEKPYVPVQCDAGMEPAGAGLFATFQGQNANIAAAFRCDLTRVITLRVGGYGGFGSYHEVGIQASHHDAAHTGPDESLAAINHFHATQFADLIARLAAIPEGSGSVLDSTVMVWGMELGLGEFTHDRTDMPFVIAGGKAAGLGLGRYLRLTTPSYQDFLYSLTQVMGLTDVTSFGDSGSLMIPELYA